MQCSLLPFPELSLNLACKSSFALPFAVCGKPQQSRDLSLDRQGAVLTTRKIVSARKEIRRSRPAARSAGEAGSVRLGGSAETYTRFQRWFQCIACHTG